MSKLVERAGNRRCGAELRLEDDDVPRGRHLPPELAEDNPLGLPRHLVLRRT